MICGKCKREVGKVVSFTGWCDACLNRVGRRDEGMQRSLRSKGEWLIDFEDHVFNLTRGDTFTSEDVTAVVGKPAGETGKDKNNAVGAAIQTLVRKGVIKSVGHAQSVNPRSNASEIKQWLRI